MGILQACRGGEEDCPSGSSRLQGSSQYNTDGPGTAMSSHEVGVMQGATAVNVPPHTQRAAASDMCFVHSSSLGYKAYRKRDEGSPFLSILADTMIARAAEVEFRDIIQEVQRTMNEQPIGRDNYSLSDFSIQLLKSWYLNPP